jgi:hypothetical protein
MRNFQPLKTVAVIGAAVFFFSACQKEITGPQSKNQENNQQATGLVQDDPELVRPIRLLVSSEFATDFNPTGRGGRDRDGDGIPDKSDACPTQKETVNGYQDSDGCPDTIPTIDTDGDGISDSVDGCPTQAETINGYLDLDGCPDTIPPPPTDSTILPPTALPSSYRLLMPPVGNQGSESSCIAWATAYARSCEYFYSNNVGFYSYTTEIVSPEFIYNLTKVNSDCSSGTAFIITLNLLQDRGVCAWQTMPYSSSNGCSLLPTSEQDTEAANYKIPVFSRIYNYDQAAIKNMIVNKHPVLTGVSIDGNFRNAYPGYIWNSYSGFSGDHGIVICGYDDAKHAYLAINSWGTYWGDVGYIWIDYDFFPSISSYYLYVMR